MEFTTENKIHYTLRIASSMCFIGHGAFGLITKEVWSNYFAVFGISHSMAFQLMPVLGTIDILMGIVLLFYPVRALFIWLLIWGIVTALLRPLSGEPLAEFLERAGNFGAPLTLLILSGKLSLGSKNLGQIIAPNIPYNSLIKSQVIIFLRCIVFLLIFGHGWLNFIEKKSFVDTYAFLGFVDPARTADAVGLIEIAAAILVLIRPFKHLVLALFAWKVATELFYPHYEVLEWVERGGSYGCILALWFALISKPSEKEVSLNNFRKYPVFIKHIFNSNKAAF